MRRFLGASVVVALLIILALPTLAGSPDENHAEFWGEDCFKIDESFGDTWVADADYRLVVAKAGQTNYQYPNVTKGDVIDPPQDISHLILCTSTTTTTLGSTTTPSSTVPTTTRDTTVSTTLLVSTTIVATTVETTIPPSTEPTTTPTTTTRRTTPSTTPSTTELVTTSSPPTTTALVVTTTDPPKELPLTGVPVAPLALSALLLLTLGGLILRGRSNA